jgi:glycerophosphoryl diester phosphodiesterase/predicted amidohydrolase
MKFTVIQPPYAHDKAKIDESVAWEIDALATCGPDDDVIVLPEAADHQGAVSTPEEVAEAFASFHAPLLDACAETARRCNAVVFVNALDPAPTGFRNTTFAFGRDGALVGKYHKAHVPVLETEKLKLDDSYTKTFSPPDILEIDGVRYAFLTCYDFYFIEQWAALAHVRPDVIIGCSRQRTDTHEALSFQNRNCAYATGAYLLRASVSMGEDSPTGGCSCAIAPDGKVLGAFTNDVGHFDVEFDPHRKFLKKAGYVGNVVSTHPEYVERGRRPCKYRPGGSAIAPFFAELPEKRLCAHRGIHNDTLPENSLPSLGAAVALGASEIEFDLWPSRDGVAIAIHDCTLERVSNGTGLVMDHTLAELRRIDFGAKSGDRWHGLGPVTFAELMDRLAGHCTMNIHIKGRGEIGEPWSVEALDEVLRIIDDHDARRHVYFMVSGAAFQEWLASLAPDIPRILGWGGCESGAQHVQLAHDLGCAGLQFFKPHFTAADVARARDLGLRANCFWSDDPDEAKNLLDMGMDTILTNDWLRLHKVLGLR